MPTERQENSQKVESHDDQFPLSSFYNKAEESYGFETIVSPSVSSNNLTTLEQPEDFPPHEGTPAAARGYAARQYYFTFDDNTYSTTSSTPTTHVSSKDSFTTSYHDIEFTEQQTEPSQMDVPLETRTSLGARICMLFNSIWRCSNCCSLPAIPGASFEINPPHKEALELSKTTNSLKRL